MHPHRDHLREKRRAIHEERTVGQTVSDGVAAVFAAWPYVLAQLTITAFWIACNTGHWFPFHWDEPPYIKLNLVYSFIAGFATSFILMAANRAAAKDRAMAQVDDEILRTDHTLLSETHTLVQQVHQINMVQSDLLEAIRAMREEERQGT